MIGFAGMRATDIAMEIPMNETLEDAGVEISLVNDLRQIAGVAARIDEFCSARDLAEVALRSQSGDRRGPDQHHQLRVR